jgi:hypothetical protein
VKIVQFGLYEKIVADLSSDIQRKLTDKFSEFISGYDSNSQVILEADVARRCAKSLFERALADVPRINGLLETAINDKENYVPIFIQSRKLYETLNGTHNADINAAKLDVKNRKEEYTRKKELHDKAMKKLQLPQGRTGIKRGGKGRFALGLFFMLLLVGVDFFTLWDLTMDAGATPEMAIGVALFFALLSGVLAFALATFFEVHFNRTLGAKQRLISRVLLVLGIIFVIALTAAAMFFRFSNAAQGGEYGFMEFDIVQQLLFVAPLFTTIVSFFLSWFCFSSTWWYKILTGAIEQENLDIRDSFEQSANDLEVARRALNNAERQLDAANNNIVSAPKELQLEKIRIWKLLDIEGEVPNDYNDFEAKAHEKAISNEVSSVVQNYLVSILPSLYADVKALVDSFRDIMAKKSVEAVRILIEEIDLQDVIDELNKERIRRKELPWNTPDSNEALKQSFLQLFGRSKS